VQLREFAARDVDGPGKLEPGEIPAVVRCHRSTPGTRSLLWP
jgi:hypothetical protein